MTCINCNNNSDKIFCSDICETEYYSTKYKIGLEKNLSKVDSNKGIKRKWIPASRIVSLLNEIRNNPSLWEYNDKHCGGQDQYTGMPPFIRNIDELIKILSNE